MEFVELFGFYKKTLDYVFLNYNSHGRAILDFLYIVFDGMFGFLLVVAIAVSALYFIMAISLFFSKKKKDAVSLDFSKAPFATVQIPTLNELAAIRCAKSCLEFDYPKDRYEILIGDDSTDKSVSEKLDEFAKLHESVRIIRRADNSGYKSGNLNNMLKHSNGEIIAIFDSDFVPHKDFLARIAAPLVNDSGVAAVQARWRMMNQSQNLVSELGAIIIAAYHYITIPFIYKKRRMSFLCGSAEAVRRDVLIKLGGWENGNLTEDIEYSLRLLKNGYRIDYLEDVECDGEVPYKPRDLYRQQMRWAYGVIHSYRKHFFDIMRSKKLNFEDKVYVNIVCTGYFFAVLLAALTVTGTLSLITHAPGPIDFGRLFFELGRNVLLTSGLLFASVVTLIKSRRARSIATMIVSSFSYGLVVTYYVNIGIFKALVKKPMQWYMLSKNGNTLAQ